MDIIWIMLAALLLRIIYLIIYSSMPEWNMLTVDNQYHFNWAKDIASGNIFGDTTYFREPFYIFCLAAVFSLFGALSIEYFTSDKKLRNIILIFLVFGLILTSF